MKSIMILLFFALLGGCGDGRPYYFGKVVNARTKLGISGISVYASYYGPARTAGNYPGHTDAEGGFRIGYSFSQGEISPRFISFHDEDGEKNGGYFSPQHILPVQDWYPTRDQEKIVEMYQCVGEGCY